MAQVVQLVLEGEGVLAGLDENAVIHQGAGHITVSSLPDGTKSGNPSVAIISKLDDGSYVFLEMSLAMFQTVNAGLRGRYGKIA